MQGLSEDNNIIRGKRKNYWFLRPILYIIKTTFIVQYESNSMSPGLYVRGRQAARVGAAVSVSRCAKGGESTASVVPSPLRLLRLPLRISESEFMPFLLYSASKC